MVGKKCGTCNFFRNPELCPSCRGYGLSARTSDGKHRLIDIACLPSDKACELYQSKNKKKSLEKIDMKEALTLLNKRIYKCPTDTKEVLVYNQGIYEEAEPLIHEILETKYGDSLKRNFVEEAYAHLQRSNYIKREQINHFSNNIPIQNGLFNFLTRTVEPFDDKVVFTFKLNVSYDPDAKCQKWLSFVKDVVAKDDIPLLQEIMGYCLVPSMPFHRMFWFYGTGRNGKGVVIRTLEAILLEKNCSELSLSEFSENRRFSLCQLYGKLLNVSSEPKLSKYGLQTNVLKMVTGQDTISSELKGRNKRLQFKNFSKIIVLGNRFPTVEDNSLGWWDRVTVLNFPNSFDGKKQIINIENQWIPKELNGIFNWMLDGLYRLHENQKFSSSKSTEETKTEFMKVSNPFKAWILERCNKIPTAYLTRDEALTSYLDYCDEIGADRSTKRIFYENMRSETQVIDTKIRIKGKTERVFQGIKLKDGDENQLSLDEVGANVADMAFPHIAFTVKNSIESKKKQVKNTAISASTATPNYDLDSLFPKGQYPICFVCGKTIPILKDLTNLDGKPCHTICKQQLNAQKKKGFCPHSTEGNEFFGCKFSEVEYQDRCTTENMKGCPELEDEF